MMTLNIEKIWHHILLIFLIFSGSFLRFFHLDYNSLWHNEAFTLFTAGHTLSGIGDIVTNNLAELEGITPTGEFSPPLFYCIEHFMLVFGQSEFILRFIPALLGTLTIPVFYYIGKEFADEDVGIVMAALISFSPFHVYYSQEARAYTTMLFLLSVAFFFFLVSLRTNRMYSWMAFGLFCGLTLWTHYYAFIPIALLFVYALFWGISRTRAGLTQPFRFVLSFVTFLIIVLPLMPVAINLFIKRTGVPSLGTKGLEVAYRIFNTLSGYHRSMMVFFCVLFIIGIFFLWKTDKTKTILITGLLVIPIIVSIFLSETMPVTDRYLIYLIPFFFLGISLSLKSIARLFEGKDVTKIVILIFFLIQVPFLALSYNTHFTKYSKADWRGIAESIEENSSKGDYIVVFPYYHRLPLDLYYSNTSHGTYEFGIRNESEIQQILPGVKNNQVFFVVVDGVTIADPDGSTIQWIQDNTTRVGMFNGIRLFKFNG